MHCFADLGYRQGSIDIGDSCEGISVIDPERKGGSSVIQDVSWFLDYRFYRLKTIFTCTPQHIRYKRQPNTLSCHRVYRYTYQSASISSHRGNCFWRHSMGRHYDVRLSLSIIEIIYEGHTTFFYGFYRLIYHHRKTLTSTMSPSFKCNDSLKFSGAIISSTSSG